MIIRFTAFLLVLSFSMLTGCASLKSGASEAPSVEVAAELAAQPPSLPSYATAIERNLPQGLVRGSVSPSDLGPVIETSGLDAASAYTRKMDSYALLVWQDGALRHVEYSPPYDAELRPESASMHKSILALVVGAAIDDGAIGSVDDPVETYLPEWRGNARGQITIRNLLQMNSGLKKLSWEGGMTSEAARFNLQGDTVRETLLGLPLETEPGASFEYANTQSQLLGLIVERATGRPYEQVLSEEIWQPVGAADAYVWYNEETGFPRTYAGLLARAGDWLRVGLLLKDHGRVDGQQILPADYINDMTTPSETNPNYGFQVWLGTEYAPKRYYNASQTGTSVPANAPFLADDMIYFDGFGGQRLYISRKLDLVIFRSGENRPDWDDAVLPNLVIEGLELAKK